ncbi:MAG: tRNA dihydrouridine synthase DusB [Christensenella sp.]|nr:tRNA dihydrouridine synthase DusB [Christensenella sp.]
MEPVVYLAPMAGITDAAMRDVCILCGAQMTFTEMVSAKGIAYQNEHTGDLLALGEQERQVCVQLFGREPDIIAQTAKTVQDRLCERLYGIDINMGCPAPKIVKNGEGSALMRQPLLAARIIEELKKAVPVRVSVKFRSGFDEKNKNAVAFAKMAEQSGADMVTVHGRTREQYYSGKADWEIIKQVKQAVGIRVIGNGDVFSPADALAMMKETGCDGVMVARGARGNPFLFRGIRQLLEEGKEMPSPEEEERIEMCLLQARLAVRYKGEEIAMRQMRTHAADYIKGIRGAARLRERVVRVTSYRELEEILRGR